MVETLSGYAVEIRYPDDCTGPSLEEAKAAYEIALNIKEYVAKMMKKEGRKVD